MKSISLLYSALALVFATVPLAAREAQVYGSSPSKAITWSVDPATNGLYLSTPHTSAKVCDVSNPRALRVTFSPDERYIFITDGSSLGTRVSLYKRSSGLKYSKVTTYDFDKATQKLAEEVIAGRKVNGTVLNLSRYLTCVGWSRSGQWAILELDGEGTLDGGRFSVRRFKCAFNPSAGTFTNDLSAAR